MLNPAGGVLRCPDGDNLQILNAGLHRFLFVGDDLEVFHLLNRGFVDGFRTAEGCKEHHCPYGDQNQRPELAQQFQNLEPSGTGEHEPPDGNRDGSGPYLIIGMATMMAPDPMIS